MVNHQFQRLTEIHHLAEIEVFTILPERNVTPLFLQVKIFIILPKVLSSLLA